MGDEMTPSVSALIPCYNGAETIRRAVESVLPNNDVEVLICDDASIDDTYEVLSDLRREYPALRVFQNEKNLGLAPSLNVLASVATGRYFIELDADDWLQADGLQKLVDALDEEPSAGFAYGQTQYHGLSNYRHMPQEYRDGLFTFGFDSLYGFLYRRTAWEAGCRYRPTTVINGKTITIQDWDMALQLIYYMRWRPIVLRDTLVLHYTHRAGSLTDFTNEHNVEVVRAFRERWPIVQASRI